MTTCRRCGYEQYDGSPHWFSGRESSRVTCFGPVDGRVVPLTAGPVQRQGVNPAPRTTKPIFSPPGQGKAKKS